MNRDLSPLSMHDLKLSLRMQQSKSSTLLASKPRSSLAVAGTTVVPATGCPPCGCCPPTAGSSRCTPTWLGKRGGCGPRRGSVQSVSPLALTLLRYSATSARATRRLGRRLTRARTRAAPPRTGFGARTASTRSAPTRNCCRTNRAVQDAQPLAFGAVVDIESIDLEPD